MMACVSDVCSVYRHLGELSTVAPSSPSPSHGPSLHFSTYSMPYHSSRRPHTSSTLQPSYTSPYSHPSPSPASSLPPHVTGDNIQVAVSKAASAWTGVITVVVVLCLLSTLVFCVVFGVLQAKAHDRMCWRHKYQPVPMHYHNGTKKVVSLSPDDYNDEDEDEEVYSAA